MESKLKPGIYKHYKGQYYRVIDVGTHTETREKLVVYWALYGDYGLYIRPLDMFLEKVKVNGKKVARFKYIKS